MNTRPLSRKLGALALTAALAAGLAACGSSSDSSSKEATTTTAAKASTTMASTKDATGTIVEVAAANPDFATLVAAVKAAGLASTLSGTGPYTVFAPTDAAFKALPAGTVDDLLKPENKAKLASILTYHVVAGKVLAADLKDGQKITTVQGGTLTVGVNGSKVTLTDESGNTVTVVKADVPASNGAIHVIDGVLLPAG